MRKILSVAVPLAVALILGNTAPAAAQNPFAIDGTITTTVNSGVNTGNSTNTKCAQPSPQACRVLDPAGATKELGPENGDSTKVGVIHTAPAIPDNPSTPKNDSDPMLAFTNPNDNVDLNTVWTQTAIAANTNIWFYFAWRREANSGSGFLAIEMQQSPVTANNNPCVYTGLDLTSNASLAALAGCNPWKNRQDGDFLFLWDQQGNSRDIYKRTFSEDAQGNLVLGPAILLTSAQAQFSADGFSGEAAINLTTDVFPPDGGCVSFANTIPGTVTGNSDSADYKDTVFATFDPISNCGMLKVVKNVSPTTATGSFPYTVARGGSLVRFASDALEHPEDGEPPQVDLERTLTEHNDSEQHNDLIPAANYTLTEGSIGPLFAFDKIICQIAGETASGDLANGATFEVKVNKLTTCTIYNKQAEGELKIIKVVNNGFGLSAVPGDFSFSLNSGAAEAFANSGTSCTSGAECKTVKFAVGTTYTVVESPTPDTTKWSVAYSNSQSGTPTNTINCSGTISATTSYCVVINTALVARPTQLTVQTARLFDQTNISGIRRGTGETAMTATFRLYSNATCTALVGTEANVAVTLTGDTGSATTPNGILVTASGTYYWVVEFSGNNFNAGRTSACGSETTQVTFAYNQ